MSRLVSRRALFLPTARPAAPPPAAAAPLPIDRHAHLLSRATFGATLADRAELTALGAEAWVDRQLDPAGIDDSAFEAALPGIVVTTSTNAADIRLLARAVLSKRQLACRMLHFLNNHFSTNRTETQPISEVQEDELFLKACFHPFRVLLRGSAQSPAMIDYLDSQSNIATAPNENYARELMELHTLGVGNYTEADVAAIARVFTGWARTNVISGSTVVASQFLFRSTVHATGPKTTSLGWSTPGFTGAAGVNEGLQFLDFLAAHPATATRFVTKLCRYFVADTPPAGLLANAIAAFTASGGSLRQTVRTILLDPEFATGANRRSKVHDGFEFVVNAVRRLGFTTMNHATLHSRVVTLRCPPHLCPVPTGWSEVGTDWQGSGNVLSRWDFADDLVNDRLSGTAVPWTTWIGPVPPATGSQWVALLVDRLLDGDVPATTSLALTVFMDARLAALPANPTWTQVRPHARALASLVLRLPEAQLQ